MKIKTKNTGPELLVRRLLRSMGYYGYVIHAKDLPGTPDIVFRSRKKIICVNGCFWHHHNCSKGKVPKKHARMWKVTLLESIKRDHRNELVLKRRGWRVFTVWECELVPRRRLRYRLRKFLDTP